MPGRAVKEKLAQDVALWQADGLIAPGTCDVLRRRYTEPGFGAGMLIRYLGIAGGVLAGCGLLGLFAVLVRSQLVGALLAAGISAALFIGGLVLASDSLGRYVHSSKVLLALAVVALGGATAVLADWLGAGEGHVLLAVGLVALPMMGFIAYRFRNVFLLVLALLGFFHWVGSWNAMLGRSTYGIAIQDPKVMSVVALLVIGIGILHEHRLQRQTSRFYLAYETVGLIYLDISLLILSIYPRSGAALYVLLLTVAALGQIVLGARLKNGLFLGFGVTAMAVNIFTRYHETFWDKLDAGLFFLIGGALLFGCSVGFESIAKRARSR
jgi:hypothetical protein